jgi:hypothetical protein
MPAPFDVCGPHKCRESRERFFQRYRSCDGNEEADELLMPVTLHAASDRLAFEHIKRGKSVMMPCRL